MVPRVMHKGWGRAFYLLLLRAISCALFFLLFFLSLGVVFALLAFRDLGPTNSLIFHYKRWFRCHGLTWDILCIFTDGDGSYNWRMVAEGANAFSPEILGVIGGKH